MADTQTGTEVERPTGNGGFFAARWAGAVPLSVLFWRDMIVIASLINLATSGAALMLFANDAPTWLAALVFISPLPYNVFLMLSVWKRAERECGSAKTLLYQLASFGWLVVATLI